MLRDLVTVIQVYVILFGLQLIIWPWLVVYFKPLLDRGWAAGRVIITLLAATALWWLSYLKLPLNTTMGVSGVLGVLIVLTFVKLRRQIRPAVIFIKHNWKVIVFEELLFIMALLGFAWIRAHQPDILGLEKFMDYGFIKSYLASPTLPAKDMWLAGKTINYYSFGHFWASILIRIWGIEPAVGYNLMLAFLFASSISIAFSVIVNLCKKFSMKSVVAGIVGALMVAVAGNTHTISTLITKGNLTGYWYADATRFIHNSIHEFPSYSFVVSDLHAHVLGLPVVLIFILVLSIWAVEEKKLVIDLLLGWLLGTMMMTNTWDIATYTMLLSICAFGRICTAQKGIRSIVFSLIRVYVFALVAASVWLFNFSSITNGVGAVVERSPLWQILYLWTIHLVLTITAGVVFINKWRKGKKENLVIAAMVLAAILLIVIPEIVYARDIYTTNPRANTMFKLTFQSFVMMSLLAGWTLEKVLSIKLKVLRIGGAVLMMLMFGALMLFPVEAYRSYYDSFSHYRGLNGTDYLRTSDPNETEIIVYLEANRDGKNMIEAVGDSFTEFNAISSYTGIPTVVGWRAHEWLWRGSYDEIGRRDGEVTDFYTNATKARPLIKKYDIGWIVLTRREKEKYKVDVTGLLKLGKVVWQKAGEYLIKVD